MELIWLLSLIIVYALIYVILNILVPKNVEKSSEYAETMGIAIISSIVSIMLYDYTELLEKNKIVPMSIILLIFILFTFLSFYEKRNGSFINYHAIRENFKINDNFEEREFSPTLEKIIEYPTIIILNILPAISIIALINVFIKDDKEYKILNIINDYYIVLNLFIILVILKFIKIRAKTT